MDLPYILAFCFIGGINGGTSAKRNKRLQVVLKSVDKTSR